MSSCSDRRDTAVGRWQYIWNRDWLADRVAISWDNVSGIDVDAATGEIYVLKRTPPYVTVWDRSGNFLRAWTYHSFCAPHYIKLLPRGQERLVYIPDMAVSPCSHPDSGACVKVFSTTGELVQTIGQCGKPGTGIDPLQFDRVTDVAADSAGFLYISDGDIGGLNHRVVKLDPGLRVVAVWDQFVNPHAVAVDLLDRIWVADPGSGLVTVLLNDGRVVGTWQFPDQRVLEIAFGPWTDGPTPGQRTAPAYLTTTGTGNALHVVPVTVDGNNPMYLSPARAVQTWPSPQSEPGLVHAVAVDRQGQNLYVAINNPSPAAFLPPLSYTLTPPKPQFRPPGPIASPPAFPEKFTAVALMHPFWLGDAVTVAEISYDSTVPAMRVRSLSLDGGYTDFLINPRGVYEIEYRDPDRPDFSSFNEGTAPLAGIKGPFSCENWKVPRRQWLPADPSQVKCIGFCPAQGVDSSWWRGQYSFKPQDAPPADTIETVDWFWFRADSQFPWRIMYHTWSSPFALPVLGDYCMIYFASFQPVSATNLAQVSSLPATPQDSPLPSTGTMPGASSYLQARTATVQNDHNSQASQVVIQRAKEVLPGIDTTPVPNPHIRGLATPTVDPWPEQLYILAMMTPVSLDSPMPTEVLYDWSQKSQRTRMYFVQGPWTDWIYDAVLDAYSTQLYYWGPDPDCCCYNVGPPGGLMMGPINPGWLSVGHAKAVLKARSVLNPSQDDVYIFQCAMQPPRILWTWYSTSGVPSVFFESASPVSEGTSLALADYYGWFPNPGVDSRAFIQYDGFSCPAGPPPQPPHTEAMLKEFGPVRRRETRIIKMPGMPLIPARRPANP
jgi:DNA-binding beta-propeller fold protein YncE